MLAKTNLLTLIATDAAGHVTKTEVAIYKSDVRIVIDPVDPKLLNNRTARVTGSVSVENCEVLVNGVKATVIGKKWVAENAPVTEGGVATFNVIATPPDNEKP